MDSDILKVYDVKEAAKIVKVSERLILHYISLGDLKARKVGREWRITEGALKDFLLKYEN